MENKFDFAKDLVYKAGAYILEHMEEGLKVEEKTCATDLVTQMDKNVQALLVSEILKHYPNDAIFAEEGQLKEDIEIGSVWVIDPIDGTANFVAQGYDFAVMVAYYENGIGQFGIIYDVMRDEMYHGGGEFEVKCNDKVLKPFRNRPLKRFLIASNAGMLERNDWGVADLTKDCLGARAYGSAAISFSRILQGRLLTYITYLYPWDYAAASILGEKLGYRVMTLDGAKPDYKTRQGIMMLPKEKISELQEYIYRRGEN